MIGDHVQLTERDLALLEWIGVCGGSALTTISDRFWPSSDRQIAGRRLAKLVQAGYLTIRHSKVTGRVFYLSSSGADKLKKYNRLHLQVGLGPDMSRQQARMIPAAICRIEQMARRDGGELVYWRTERELRAEVVRARKGAQGAPVSVPDAQAVIKYGDGSYRQINIEIDGQYYGLRLAEKLERLSESGQTTLWCCTGDRAAYLRKRLEDCHWVELLVLGEEPG